MDDSIRNKILTLLDQHRIMTIATLRPDGWPQATTVGYVNEGLALYFLCGLDSQKAANLARDNRVSLTIDHDTPDLMAITGLSMAARAEAVTDRSEAEKVLRMLPLKYPEQTAPLPFPMPTPDDIRIFRVTPTVIIEVITWPPPVEKPVSPLSRAVLGPMVQPMPVTMIVLRSFSPISSSVRASCIMIVPIPQPGHQIVGNRSSLMRSL